VAAIGYGWLGVRVLIIKGLEACRVIDAFEALLLKVLFLSTLLFQQSLSAFEISDFM